MSQPTHPLPLDPAVVKVVAQLDENRLEAWRERAAIMEFDAGLPRLEAERQALIDTFARHGLPQAPLSCLLHAEINGCSQWVLSTDAGFARQQLIEIGASAIEAADLDDVVRSQYRDLAFLSTSS
ncbi:hypothetical protein [Uliginosibacterium sp. 31-12]|uniref:hypothetical protein n=1 Tax=Uliginosibacterium sp. 31-12 TaxID=3062781 RepID=UPI0026E19228|nr:hypothetical protein [Uliginosibacterium sp. 31-12]MDO6384697.1 hypothetical protein [Uliginosibacterium sp. 31-12]